MSERRHDPGHFLAGIAALLRRRTGEYLFMKRGADHDFGAGLWECVTGRVNQGEAYEAAMHREVMEETGLRVRIDTIVGLSHFYRGEPVPENELQGVVFGCSSVTDEEVRRSPEHSEHRWMPAEEALAFLTGTDPGALWFRRTIERAEELYAILPADWQDIHADGVTLS
ncbi:MAG: NUDIX domain-containing protein [Candidatus Latescibacteria bacterium]|mgnify:FL=1|jgi:8-oxo-dGTP pyrophosphatase MutT (NUDIX family)|nr:NUDIX domain-containing protein [Candidatus Latescibacterota bacterium]MDP7447450.1 NUDIX domain-containing protein [Candidatus Latescibacterota bacterium]